MSRLVPTESKAISMRASPPMGWTDRTMPLPKALWTTASPFWKEGRLAAGRAPGAGRAALAVRRVWGAAAAVRPVRVSEDQEVP